MVIELYCLHEATMTKLTKKQESLLNELLADFKGDTEAVMDPGWLDDAVTCPPLAEPVEA
jgi:hypothetical protein